MIVGRQRWHQLRNLGIEQANLLIDEVDLRQLLGNQETMMVTHYSGQRLLQRITLATQPPLG
ncbi:MAG: hypothetical protein KDI55_29520, partial [Anaerolineae bacterium]|nr:hypothetical protein [Anaerolineae bacterium]